MRFPMHLYGRLAIFFLPYPPRARRLQKKSRTNIIFLSTYRENTSFRIVINMVVDGDRAIL